MGRYAPNKIFDVDGLEIIRGPIIISAEAEDLKDPAGAYFHDGSFVLKGKSDGNGFYLFLFFDVDQDDGDDKCCDDKNYNDDNKQDCSIFELAFLGVSFAFFREHRVSQGVFLVLVLLH